MKPNKLKSITKLFPVISPQELPYYPGGAAYLAAYSCMTHNLSASADDEELDQDENSPSLPVMKKIQERKTYRKTPANKKTEKCVPW